jgi:hypothetical protein
MLLKFNAENKSHDENGGGFNLQNNSMCDVSA